MKTTNSLSTKFLIGTFIFTFIFGALSVYALRKANSEDPNVIQKIEAALQKHYGRDKFNFNISMSDNESALSNQTFDMPVNKISINTSSGSIMFHTIKGSTQVVIKTDGPGDQLKLADDKSLMLDENSSFGSSDVIVEVPENFDGTISLKSVSGDIKISNLSSQMLAVTSVSGEITVDQIWAKKTVLYSVSGDIKLIQKNSGDVAINTISGDVGINLSKSSNGFNFAIKSLSGEITNALKGQPAGTVEVVVTTTSGDVNIQ